MKLLRKIKRLLSLLLAVFMTISANLPMSVSAEDDNAGKTAVETGQEDIAAVEANAAAVSEVTENGIDDVSEMTQTKKVQTKSGTGFQISIEWEDSEFKLGNCMNIVEDTDNTNAVKLRVSYSNHQVSEIGYQPGDLIITVKGIGAVKRNGLIEAQCGADKASEGTKNRDWSYTWSKSSDTYTFTNNHVIKPNSVVSGYFDMLWNVKARDSVHGYCQDDISAELLLPNGESAVSEKLNFQNSTVCDEYSIDIDKAALYSSSGISDVR